MLVEKVLGNAIAAAGDGATLEQNTSPFYPRHKVLAKIRLSDDFAGQMIIEASDTGLFAGEEVTELDTGVIAATADKTDFEVEVTLKKYARYSMTSRTAGTGSAARKPSRVASTSRASSSPNAFATSSRTRQSESAR